MAQEPRGESIWGVMTAIQRWLLCFVLTVAAVALAYEWVDRPLAFLAHASSGQRETFASFTHIPDPMIPLGGLAFVGIGLWVLARRPLTRVLQAAVLCGVSVIVAETIKQGLKYAFGRYWPETWVQNNPSLIRDGAYGFNWFHGGAGYASFPSGHTTVTCAVISVLWLLYPRWRPLYALIVLAVGIGLIGADYHFLSDVIAGGFLGVSIGWMTVALWQARPDPPLLSPPRSEPK